MVTYQKETLKHIRVELEPLLEEHYKEIAWRQDKIKLRPNYVKYYELEHLGILHVVTARDEGKLIGYFISFIMPHFHYMDTMYANNDILFIDKEYRKGRNAIKLFKTAEKLLKEKGVDVISLHMKVAQPFQELAEYLGYEHVEYGYSKYIGE